MSLSELFKKDAQGTRPYFAAFREAMRNLFEPRGRKAVLAGATSVISAGAIAGGGFTYIGALSRLRDHSAGPAQLLLNAFKTNADHILRNTGYGAAFATATEVVIVSGVVLFAAGVMARDRISSPSPR